MGKNGEVDGWVRCATEALDQIWLIEEENCRFWNIEGPIYLLDHNFRVQSVLLVNTSIVLSLTC